MLTELLFTFLTTDFEFTLPAFSSDSVADNFLIIFFGLASVFFGFFMDLFDFDDIARWKIVDVLKRPEFTGRNGTSILTIASLAFVFAALTGRSFIFKLQFVVCVMCEFCINSSKKNSFISLLQLHTIRSIFYDDCIVIFSFIILYASGWLACVVQMI